MSSISLSDLSMNLRTDGPILECVSELIHPVLEEAGFYREGVTWMRYWGWKQDEIRLDNRYENSTLILMSVYLPLEKGVPILQSPSGTTLHNLIDGYPSSFYWPWLKIGRRRLLKTIENAMPNAMDWFDRYATPASCLDNLLTPNVNPESNSYKYWQRYLMDLSEEYNSGACLIKDKWPDFGV